MSFQSSAWFRNACRLILTVFVFESVYAYPPGMEFPWQVELRFGPSEALGQGTPEDITDEIICLDDPNAGASRRACTADADTTDPYVLAKRDELRVLGDDSATTENVFRFVRDEVSFEGYVGSLRGARGTLWAGSGNSLDQASLMIALLRASEIDASYACGAISDADARTLVSTMFRDPEGVVGVSADGGGGPDPFVDEQLIQEAQDHCWVEVGSSLSPYDPAAPWLQGALSPSQRFDAVPAEKQHWVSVRLDAELVGSGLGGSLRTESPLDVAFPSAGVVGRPMVLKHLLSVTGGGFFGLGIVNYWPSLVVSDLDDDVFDDPSVQQSSYQEVQLLAVIDQVTRLALAVSLRTPGGEPSSYEHVILDRVGIAGRTGGATLLLGEEPTRAAGPSDYTTLVVGGAAPEPDMLSRTLAQHDALVAEVDRLENEIELLPEGPEAQGLRADLYGYYDALGVAATVLLAGKYLEDSYSLSTELADELLLRTYPDAPTLTVSFLRGDFSSETPSVELGLNLLRNGLRVVQWSGQDRVAEPLFRMIRGAAESVLEDSALPPASSFSGPNEEVVTAGSARRSVEGARDDGVPVVGLDEAALSTLEAMLDLSPDSLVRIGIALAAGRRVVTPVAASASASSHLESWYEVDAGSGEVSDVNEAGGHSAIVEHTIFLAYDFYKFTSEKGLLPIWRFYVCTFVKTGAALQGQTPQSCFRTRGASARTPPLGRTEGSPSCQGGCPAFDAVQSLLSIPASGGVSVFGPLGDRAVGLLDALFDEPAVPVPNILVRARPAAPGGSDVLALSADSAFVVGGPEVALSSAYRAVIHNPSGSTQTFSLSGTVGREEFAVVPSVDSLTVESGSSGVVGLYLVPRGVQVPVAGTDVPFDVSVTSDGFPPLAGMATGSFVMPSVPGLVIQVSPDRLSVTPAAAEQVDLRLEGYGNARTAFRLIFDLPSGVTVSAGLLQGTIEPAHSIASLLSVEVTPGAPRDVVRQVGVVAEFCQAESFDSCGADILRRSASFGVVSRSLAAQGAESAALSLDEAGDDDLAQHFALLTEAVVLLEEQPSDARICDRTRIHLSNIITLMLQDPDLAEFVDDEDDPIVLLRGYAQFCDVPSLLGVLPTAFATIKPVIAGRAEHRFEVSATPTSIEFEPGVDTDPTIAVAIENLGTKTTTVDLALNGGIPVGAALNPSSLVLSPGQGGSASVALTGLGDAPLVFPVTVTGTAQENNTQADSATTHVAVRPALAKVISVTPNPNAIDEGASIMATAAIMNSANAQRTVVAKAFIPTARAELMPEEALATQVLNLAPSTGTDPVDFGLIDTSMLNDGLHQLEVRLFTESDAPLGSSAMAPFYVGQPVSAVAYAEPSMVPPGDAVVETTIEVTAGELPTTEECFYFQDFEDPADPLSEWSDTRTDTTPIGARRFLGQFGNEWSALSLSDLPPHTELTVELDVYGIRTLDGNGDAPCCPGPDVWRISTPELGPVVNTTFVSFTVPSSPTASQAFPDQYPGGSNPLGTGASESGTLGYLSPYDGTPSDRVFPVSATIAHVGDSLSMSFSAAGLQNMGDESWGIDNVCVRVSGSSDQSVDVEVRHDMDPDEHQADLGTVMPAADTSSSSQITWSATLGAGGGCGQQGEPEVLSGWTQVDLAEPATWSVSSPTVVVFPENDNSSIWLSPIDVADTCAVEGTFRTTDAGDEDLMGFVFGYQNSEQFYVFDWKRNAEGACDPGMNLSLVDGRSGNWRCDPAAVGFSQVFENDTIWYPNRLYRYRLEFVPGEFRVSIWEDGSLVETFTVHDDSYQNGLFGLFNHSQPGTVYSDVRVTPRTPATGSSASFMVNGTAPGMAPGEVREISTGTEIVATIGTAQGGGCLASPQVNVFPSSVYSADSGALDAAVGVTGFAIEDFEDVDLLAGLTIDLSGGTPPPVTHVSLPNVGAEAATWDGQGAVSNDPANAYVNSDPDRASSVTFGFSGGASSVGVGLSGFQSIDPPSSQYPITNHNLYVNGCLVGELEALAGADWSGSPFSRDVYVRVDAGPGETIHSIGFENIAPVSGTVEDFLEFDHLAIQPGSRAALVIAGLSRARSGEWGSFPEGNQNTLARASAETNFPGTSFRALDALDAASLEDIDLLVLAAADGDTTPAPISAPEQSALIEFVAGGGCAILSTDHGPFSAASDGLVSPFGIDAVGGQVGGVVSATVVVPAPFTQGPFGQVVSFGQAFAATLGDLGPYASAVATNPGGTALAYIPPDAIQEGAGPVIVFSDSNTFWDDGTTTFFSSNENLFLNALAYCGQARGGSEIVLPTIHLPPITVVAKHIIAITPPTETVAPGGTATYTVELTNPLDTEVIYELDLIGDEETWEVNHAASQLVASGATVSLSLTISVPASSRNLVQTISMCAETAEFRDCATAELVVEGDPPPVEGLERLAVAVELEPLEEVLVKRDVNGDETDRDVTIRDTVGQGTQAKYVATVTNLGEETDNYDLRCNVPAGFTCGFRNAQGETVTDVLGILPGLGNSRQVLLTLTPPDPVSGPTQPFSVTATSKTDTDVDDTADADVNVSGYGVEVQLSPNSGVPGQAFDVTVTNTGDQTDTFDLEMGGPAGNDATPREQEVGPLAPGASQVISVAVGRLGFALPGGIDLVAFAKSQGEPRVRDTAAATITVPARRLVEAECTPTPQEPDEQGDATFLFIVDNLGNQEEAYTAKIVSSGGGAVSAFLENLDGLPVMETDIFRLPGLSTGAVPVLATLTGSAAATITIDVLTKEKEPVLMGTATCSLALGSQAPVADAGPDQLLAISGDITVDASFTDDDAGDTHTATIDWGDGSSVEPVTVDQDAHILSANHTFAGAGPYTVEVCVTDSEQQVGCDELVVSSCETCAGEPVVVDEAITIDASDVGGTAGVLAAFTTFDGETITVDLGDAPLSVTDSGLISVLGRKQYHPAEFHENGNHRSPNLVIRACSVRVDESTRKRRGGITRAESGVIETDSEGRKVGDILVDAANGIEILGTVQSIQLKKPDVIDALSGEVTLRSSCGGIHVGPKALVMGFAGNGTSPVNLESLGVGDIEVEGLVLNRTNLIPEGVDVPEINVHAAQGRVVVDGSNLVLNDWQLGGRRSDVTGGLLTISRRRGESGRINVQASGDIEVTRDVRGLDLNRRSYAAISTFANERDKFGGQLRLRSLGGGVMLRDFALDASGRKDNSSALVEVIADQDIVVATPVDAGAEDPTITTDARRSGNVAMGGTVVLKSCSEGVSVEVGAVVSSEGETADGVNELTGSPVTVNGTVVPGLVAGVDCDSP